MFALGEVLDAFFDVVADAADGDYAILVPRGFSIEGFHQCVGEEAVGLIVHCDAVDGVSKGRCKM